MKLEQLLQNIQLKAQSGVSGIEITSLAYDSRQVKPGCLFFALKGVKSDGHGFITAAVEAGAVAVVLQDRPAAPPGIPWLQVENSRQVMALLADRFYGQPSQKQPLIGITGTNGKTTTSYLVEGIMQAAGQPAAVLGTISYRFKDVCLEADHTTPESIELQQIMAQLVEAGASSFVMEVSSHSLEQHRVDGCHFDVGLFTNLTRDHLDYHGNMENYLAAKARLFNQLLRSDEQKPLRHAVINLDDPAGAELARQAVCPVISYGLKNKANVTARNVSSSVGGITATLVTPVGEQDFHSDLVGDYNLSNLLAAAATGIALKLPLATIVKGLEQHRTVPGRLEKVENSRGVTCLVDYAHTGDALENVLKTLKQLAQARIITIFGCGGDRDNGKRPVMGAIAAGYSDLAICTSDNPRTEDPFRILTQIRAGILPLGLREYQPDELTPGFTEKGFVTIENRRNAIRLGAALAQPGDILLLAGKGHEDYQILGTVKHHFDDCEEAARAFTELQADN